MARIPKRKPNVELQLFASGTKSMERTYLTIFLSDSGRASPIKLAQVTKAGVAFDDDLVEDICATICANKIGVFILDPFIATHGVPESDNTDIDAVVKELAFIADMANCAVEFAHHARKANAQQSETTAEDARGASAIINAVRSARVLNRMTKEQADETRIAEPRSYFRVDSGKANLAPPAAAKWLHLTGVEIANGDNVAVVEPWKYPSPMDQVTSALMYAVREMARTGDWRKEPKSDEWIGHAVAEVLGLDIDKPDDRKKIKGVLSIWFRNKVLDTAKRRDAHRKERQFVVPGDWKEDSQ
jgi:AAA domain